MGKIPKLKVFVEDGLVTNILSYDGVPVDIEVVDIDKDHDDYEQLLAYKKELEEHPDYKECTYSVADFNN